MSADYDSQAASLLADIADALLNGKQNWQILEQLQQALRAKTGLERLAEVNDIFTKANAEGLSKPAEDLITKAYAERMRYMLKPDPSFEGSKTFYNVRPGGDTYTTNSASYSHTISPETFPKYPYGYGGNSSKT